MFLQISMKSFVHWSDHPSAIGRCVSWVVSNQFAQTLKKNENEVVVHMNGETFVKFVLKFS